MIHATSVVKKIHNPSTSMVVAKKKRLYQLLYGKLVLVKKVFWSNSIMYSEVALD